GLPSRVVGTPGVDRSAGMAASEVAKDAGQATLEGLQNAKEDFNQARSEFDQSFQQSMFANMNAQERARHARNMAADLSFALKKPDLDEHLNNLQSATDSEITAASTNDPMAPLNAAKNFGDRAKPLIDSLNMDKTLTPELKNKMVSYISEGIASRQNYFQTKSAPWVQNNIQAGINAAPLKAQAVLDNADVSQPVSAQALLTGKAIQDMNLVNGVLKEQFKAMPVPGGEKRVAAIEEAQQKNTQTLTASGIENMLAGVTPTADGLQRIKEIRSIVQQPPHGMLLTPEKKVSFLSALDTKEKEYEQRAVDILKTRNSIAAADINKDILYPLAKADTENDPTTRTQLQAAADKRMEALNLQLEQAEKMPDGRLKQETILGIKQQQGQLIGGGRQLLNEADRYESKILREISMARSEEARARAENQRDVSNQIAALGVQTQLSNQQFQQGQNTARQLAAMKENNFLKEKTRISAMPVGPDQHNAAVKLNKDVEEHTNWAVARGIMDPKAAASYLNEYGTKVLTSTLYNDREFFGQHWYTPKAQATALQKQKNAKQVAEEQTKILKTQHDDGNRLSSILQLVGHNNLNMSQQLALSEHLRRNFMPSLERVRTKGLRPEQEDRWTQAFYNAAFEKARNGALDEQLLEKKLKLKQGNR
ncbi:MAG: hypothetical protein KGI50_06965, partial [Patescibacteria group bacterium]|nr:hypothetical protein [Patescibacteria group bacterium]